MLGVKVWLLGVVLLLLLLVVEHVVLGVVVWHSRNGWVKAHIVLLVHLWPKVAATTVIVVGLVIVRVLIIHGMIEAVIAVAVVVCVRLVGMALKSTAATGRLSSAGSGYPVVAVAATRARITTCRCRGVTSALGVFRPVSVVMLGFLLLLLSLGHRPVTGLAAPVLAHNLGACGSQEPWGGDS